MMSSKRLTLSVISIDGGTQPRERIDQTIVAEYCDAMIEGAKFPPVVVFFKNGGGRRDFDDGSGHWLADGFHRFHAASKAGLKDIEADVRKGTLRDAVLYSVGANNEHGLRRTNADKRRSVMTLLEDDEWVAWSNREIARKCAVDHTFVGKLRNNLSGVKPQIENRKVARGGKTYTQSTANIGRNKAETQTEIVDTKTGEVLENAAVMKTTVKKLKHTETHEVSDAMGFAEIAITQLGGIRHDDPNKGKALRRVAAWIAQALGA